MASRPAASETAPKTLSLREDWLVDWPSVGSGALLVFCGAILGYGLRLAEAIRADRVRCYGAYLRLINGFPMRIAAAVDLDADAAVADFRQFQSDALAASTELFVVGTNRTAAEAVAIGRALSDAELWNAVEVWGRAPDGDAERRRFFDAYFAAVRAPRQRLLRAMRRDLRLIPLRAVTLEDAETVRPSQAPSDS